jgi:hypothetical protein
MSSGKMTKDLALLIHGSNLKRPIILLTWNSYFVFLGTTFLRLLEMNTPNGIEEGS